MKKSSSFVIIVLHEKVLKYIHSVSVFNQDKSINSIFVFLQDEIVNFLFEFLQDAVKYFVSIQYQR